MAHQASISSPLTFTIHDVPKHGAHAEARRPEGLSQRHRCLAAVGERLEDPGGSSGSARVRLTAMPFIPAPSPVGSSEAMSRSPEPKLSAAWMTRSGVRGPRRRLRTLGHVGDGHHVELTAQDLVVVVHRLAAGAAEEQVRVDKHGVCSISRECVMGTDGADGRKSSLDVQDLPWVGRVCPRRSYQRTNRPEPLARRSTEPRSQS